MILDPLKSDPNQCVILSHPILPDYPVDWTTLLKDTKNFILMSLWQACLKNWQCPSFTEKIISLL